MAVRPSVGTTRLGSRAQIGPKITRTSGSGWWRLKCAILAVVSDQVRPRLAAWSRDKWHQGICNPRRGGEAARFADDGAREGGGGSAPQRDPPFSAQEKLA